MPLHHTSLCFLLHRLLPNPLFFVPLSQTRVPVAMAFNSYIHTSIVLCFYLGSKITEANKSGCHEK